MKRLIPRMGLNPIIVKEIRSRMRGPRAFITLTIILLLTGGIMAALLQIIMATSSYTTVLSAQVGQTLFSSLVFLELAMVCAVTPAVTAGAISGEKEKQTYEMLMATPLSPTRILWGKLISAMSYVLLLLFAAVPLASLVFIFGGVAPSEMLKALLMLVLIAVTFGILGLFMSALFGRTGRATVASFVVVALLTFGPLFLAILVGVITENEPPRWILAPSPISALSSAIVPRTGGQSWVGIDLFYILGGIWNMGVSSISQTEIPRPIYHYTIPLYLFLSLILLMLSTQLIQPARRWRLRRKEVLISAGLILGLLLIVAAGFFATANRYEWARRGRGAPTLEPMFVGPAAPDTIQREAVVVAQPALEATPTPAPPPTEAPVTGNQVETNLDFDSRVEIYSAVARQLYTVDHTFGDKAPNFPLLYLVRQTDDSVGDPNLIKEDPVILEEDVQEAITESLSDLPAEIQWAGSLDQVPKDPQSGTVHGNGAVITFGNIHLQDDSTVFVSASLYFSGLGATGMTYILSNETGEWTVTGTTGVEWIS